VPVPVSYYYIARIQERAIAKRTQSGRQLFDNRINFALHKYGCGPPAASSGKTPRKKLFLQNEPGFSLFSALFHSTALGKRPFMHPARLPSPATIFRMMLRALTALTVSSTLLFAQRGAHTRCQRLYLRPAKSVTSASAGGRLVRAASFPSSAPPPKHQPLCRRAVLRSGFVCQSCVASPYRLKAMAMSTSMPPGSSCAGWLWSGQFPPPRRLPEAIREMHVASSTGTPSSTFSMNRASRSAAQSRPRSNRTARNQGLSTSDCLDSFHTHAEL
jgi:hypothetical protein